MLHPTFQNILNNLVQPATPAQPARTERPAPVPALLQKLTREHFQTLSRHPHMFAEAMRHETEIDAAAGTIFTTVTPHHFIISFLNESNDAESELRYMDESGAEYVSDNLTEDEPTPQVVVTFYDNELKAAQTAIQAQIEAKYNELRQIRKKIEEEEKDAPELGRASDEYIEHYKKIALRISNEIGSLRGALSGIYHARRQKGRRP